MSLRKRSPLGSCRRPEALESRELLAGHGFAAFAHAAAGAAIQQAGQFSAATAGARGAGHDGVFTAAALHARGGDSAATNLSATLTDATTGATATINFKSYVEYGVTETSLKVTITGAAADSTLDVSIGGTVVGQIVTDANGKGSLVLSSDPTGDQQALPDDFPTDIAAGTAVSVGESSGTLATGSTRGGPRGSCHGDATAITATLSDAGTGATGTATYRTSTVDGATSTKLKVSVTGAAVSSSLDVTIDGTVVGQLTTDATGAGSFGLSNAANVVQSGSTITVGSLTGTFASSVGQSVLRAGRHR